MRIVGGKYYCQHACHNELKLRHTCNTLAFIEKTGLNILNQQLVFNTMKTGNIIIIHISIEIFTNEYNVG